MRRARPLVRRPSSVRGPGRARSGRRRPQEARRRAETRRALLILFLAGAAMLGVAGVWFVSRSPRVDAQSGCVAGQLVPPAHTVVLIDQTDALTRRQIDYVKTLILAEYAHLQPQGELTIRSIRSDPEGDDHAFSRCRVRRGAEVSGLISNPEMIEATFRKTVGSALNDYLNSLRNVPTSPRSPILEAVDSTLDSADFGPTVKTRRLVLVSDMAQNSATLSEYRGPGSGLTLSPKTRETLSRDMHGVVVRIHYVRRPELSALQTPEQRAFWTDWFERQGAQVKLGWGLQLADSGDKRGR